jgi:Skp family chaperone for outer membrane proteins
MNEDAQRPVTWHDFQEFQKNVGTQFEKLMERLDAEKRERDEERQKVVERFEKLMERLDAEKRERDEKKQKQLDEKAKADEKRAEATQHWNEGRYLAWIRLFPLAHKGDDDADLFSGASRLRLKKMD